MIKTSRLMNSQFNLKPDTCDEVWLFFDIETDGLYDQVTKIHCIVIHDIQKDKTYCYNPAHITDAIHHLKTADVLIGHNIIFYDIPVIEKLFPGLLPTKDVKLIDTLVCTRLIWPKEKLYDMDAEQYIQVPLSLRGSASLKAWGFRLADYKIEFKDFSEYSEEMLQYCKQDVQVTQNLFNHIQNQSIAPSSLRLEHDFARSIEKQIRSGFPFDIDLACSLVDELNAKKVQLEDELKQIFPPVEHKDWFTPKVNNKSRGYIKGVPFCKIRKEEFNPGSRQQITQRLKDKYDWKPEKLTDKGNPILDDEVLERLPYPEAKPLAEYMLIKKRLGQIKDGNNAWLKLVDYNDNCIHGDVVTNGCITGRCSHRRPNTAQTPATYSPYGKACRSLFHAPNDWFLIGVDAKALELRCLAGYLAIWDKGEYGKLVIDETVDIHIINQQKFGVKTRDISKRLLYAVLYGAGFLKAGSIVDPNEKDEDKLRDLGKTAINSFMDGVPALKKMKKELANSLITRGHLVGLDKRPLFCRSDFKALNVLLQSAGAVIMKQVVVNVQNNLNKKGLVYGIDYQQHAMIHDEIELSCPSELIETVKEQALLAFPAAGKFFNFRCRIDGDAKVGKNWAEVH